MICTAPEITKNNFEISLVVFMPNITTNHAITYTKTLDPETIPCWAAHYTLNVRSRGKKFCFTENPSWCFPRRSQGNPQDWRKNKTNWFPEGPDIECFVIFLDFHFNSNKRITGAKQNSRLGTYNKHKSNSQNHWMNDLHSTFHILSASSSSTSCFFSSRITLKIVAF